MVWLWVCLAIFVVGTAVNAWLARQVWRRAKSLMAVAGESMTTFSRGVAELERLYQPAIGRSPDSRREAHIGQQA